MGDNGVELPPVAPSNTNTPVEQLQCTICLSAEFAQECRINGCNHAFCFICIAEWVCQSLRPSCPMCRHDVDKVSYDFTEQQNGRKEIAIREFRSGHMTLTPSDRNQLLGERRVVVRNLMHSYKVAGLLASEITDIDDSKEPNDILKEAIEELLKIITQHIQNAELSLVDLRTDIARKNKSVVFKSLTFRRMIYSRKIKLKYPDQKRQKLKPEDLSKEPERFRNVVVDFLVSEFDAIPHQNQPELAGQKWRTKFLGGSISLDQKQQYAAQIYDLMLVTAVGSDEFQKGMNDILTVVSSIHIKLLDDHLEAIVAVEKTKIEEFYNVIYYDSVYNSFSQNFFDYNAMINVRDDPQGRFEAIFSQIHREMNPADWVNPYARFMTVRAAATADRVPTGGDTSGDSSDEERVATPMPDGNPTHGVARVYFERLLEIPDTDTGPERAHELVRRYERVHALRRNNRQNEGPTPTGQTTRTLPLSEQTDSSRTHMTLRSSARREREAAQGQTLAQAGPPHPDDLVRRIIGFRDDSDDIVELLRPGPPRTLTTSTLFAAAPPPATVEVTIRPRTVYEMRPVQRRGRGGNETADPSEEQPGRTGPHYMAYFQTVPRRGFVDPFAGTPFAMDPTQPPITLEPPVQPAPAVNTQEDVNPPGPDTEVTSIARRTRAARRADREGRSGPPSGAPPPKRSSISRRDVR